MFSAYSTLTNPYRLLHPSPPITFAFNWFDNVHPLADLSKDNMMVIEPRRHGSGYKKLGVVGIRTTVGHGQYSFVIMLVYEIFILEGVPINWFPTCSITKSYITPLYHKTRYYPVESTRFIMQIFTTYSFSFLSGAKTFKIFPCDRAIIIQLKHNHPLHNAIKRNLKKCLICQNRWQLQSHSFLGHDYFWQRLV